MKYKAYYQNGGFAEFDWDGDHTDEEQLDDLLEASYQAAPPGLCNHCSRNFEISEDQEVYEIREVDSDTEVFKEATWSEQLQIRASQADAKSSEFHRQVVETRRQRDSLVFILRKAGFTVDPDTFVVSR